MIYLPSYHDCLEFCEKNPQGFYEKKTLVEGVKVSLFDYWFPTYQDFSNPVGDGKRSAFELRGITFVHENNETKRFILLHKFFNLNQVESYQFHTLKHLRITQSQDKADGSVIRFVPINGKLYAKSKMTFESAQAIMAQKMIESSEELKAFVWATIEEGIAAVFELISPANQIVLSYPKTELRLLQMREEASGRYLDIYGHHLVEKYNIPCTTKEDDLSWESLLKRQKEEEGREGWILTLENGQMVKLKTEWYCSRHGILMDGLMRENLMIQYSLNETMDDALALISPNDFRYQNAVVIDEAVKKDLHAFSSEALRIAEDFSNHQERKNWFMAHKDHRAFSVASKLIGISKERWIDQVHKKSKEELAKKTYGLKNAQEYLKSLGVKLIDLTEMMDEGR